MAITPNIHGSFNRFRLRFVNVPPVAGPDSDRRYLDGGKHLTVYFGPAGRGGFRRRVSGGGLWLPAAIPDTAEERRQHDCAGNSERLRDFRDDIGGCPRARIPRDTLGSPAERDGEIRADEHDSENREVENDGDCAVFGENFFQCFAHRL